MNVSGTLQINILTSEAEIHLLTCGSAALQQGVSKLYTRVSDLKFVKSNLHWDNHQKIPKIHFQQPIVQTHRNSKTSRSSRAIS